MNPEGELQFRDQVDQMDHEMFQEEYRERLAETPVYLRPGYVREMDEDEAMDAEREMDCE